MPKKIEMIGKKFGRLIVIRDAGKNNSGEILWECLCDCGQNSIVRGSSLRSKITKSCGCLTKETATTHGMSRTLTYRSWDAMIQRCNNPKYTGYKDWGGRGITVCGRWLKFESFLEDMGIRPEGLTLERKNNRLGYYKKNCLWDTYIAQGRNQRISKRNKTGIRGVCWVKKNQKYQVTIRVDREQIYLGLFADLKKAATIRKQAEQKYWR